MEHSIKITLILVGLLIITGEKLIPFILGAKWKEAGQYIAILGVIYTLKFCSLSLSGINIIMGKIKISMWMSLLNLIKYTVCFGLSYLLRFGILETITIYAGAECCYLIVDLMANIYCTGYSMRKCLVFVLKYIIGGNLVIYGVHFFLKTIIY